MIRQLGMCAIWSVVAVAALKPASAQSSINAKCGNASEEERKYINERHAQCLAQYGARTGHAQPRNGQNCIYAACEQFHGCGAEDGTADPSRAPPQSTMAAMVLDQATIIRQLQDMPMTRSCTRAVDDYTACNAFVSEALSRVYGIDDFKKNKSSRTFPDLVANDIAKYVETHSQWQRLGTGGDQRALDDAQRLANEGYAVIAVLPSTGQGHVALVIPGESQRSTTWGLRVPNSASMFYRDPAEPYVPDQTYIGGMLSRAFQAQHRNEVLIYYRSRFTAQ
jgi:hypothetical protein